MKSLLKSPSNSIIRGINAIFASCAFAYAIGMLDAIRVYIVRAYDKNGILLGKTINMAEGSGIYTVTNALCAAYPGATVVIKDAKAGEELKSESPHKCK
ncbi:MAG TPA: hypothetical protein VFX01_03075 [Methylophilaceae bacterium]|nr:hypothetical protein [Methylophilaceae bacterium]